MGGGVCNFRQSDRERPKNSLLVINVTVLREEHSRETEEQEKIFEVITR